MSNLLSFIGGLGAGAMTQYEREKDRDRQNRQDDRLDRQEQRQVALDAQAKQLHDRNMEVFKRADANREADIVAAKPIAAQTYTQSSTAGMSDTQKQQLAEDMSSGLVGDQAYSVAGKDFGTNKAESDKALAAANTQDAINARRVQAKIATGRADEADALSATLRQGRAADRTEKDALIQEANSVWNTSVFNSIKKTGDIHGGLAAVLSDTEVGAAAGTKFKAVPSKDGKMIQYIATDSKGNQSVFRSYPAGPKGEQWAVEDTQRVSPETQLKFLAERRASEAAEAKALRDAKVDDAKIRLMGAQGLHYSNMGRGGSGSGGAAGLGDFDPLGNLDHKNLQSAASKEVADAAKAAAEAGTPLTDKQLADMWTSNYQSKVKALDTYVRDDHTSKLFSNALRASGGNPQQYGEVFKKAVDSGFTPQQLAKMGFYPPKPPELTPAQKAELAKRQAYVAANPRAAR